MKLPSFGHDARVNTLICCGHTLSHFYILMLPTMFLAWQQAFGVSFLRADIEQMIPPSMPAPHSRSRGFSGARRSPV